MKAIQQLLPNSMEWILAQDQAVFLGPISITRLCFRRLNNKGEIIMKTKLMIGVAVALGLLTGTTAMADQLRINLVTRDYRLSRSDAATVATISAALHFRDRDVVNWARDCRSSVRDVGPAYVISYYTREPVERIWRDRRGRDWYDYGLDRGVNWDRFNRLDLSYRDFDRMLWLNLSNNAYGCDEPLWDDLSDQGLSFNDVIITIVLGDGRRDRCDYYAYQYRNHNRDWGRWWTSADRDSRLWVGYRDNNWRTDRRYDRDDRDRNWQNDRDRNRDRQRELDRDRQARERAAVDRYNRDRQQRLDRLHQDQERAARDQQIRDQRNRDRQQQLDRDRQVKDRAARDKQVRDQQNRDRQNNRDKDRDRSRGDDKRSRDRDNSDNRGR
jgi:hypothetical protein